MARTSNRVVAGIGAVLLVISHVAFAYNPEVSYMYASYGVVYGKHSVLQSIARKIYVKKRNAYYHHIIAGFEESRQIQKSVFFMNSDDDVNLEKK